MQNCLETIHLDFLYCLKSYEFIILVNYYLLASSIDCDMSEEPIMFTKMRVNINRIICKLRVYTAAVL